MHNASKNTVITLFIIFIVGAIIVTIWKDDIIPSEYHKDIDSLITKSLAYDELSTEGISKIKKEVDRIYVDNIMFYFYLTESDGLQFVIIKVRENDGEEEYKHVAHFYYTAETFEQELSNAKTITVNDEGNRVGFYISNKKNTIQAIDNSTPEIKEYNIQFESKNFNFIFAYGHITSVDISN